MSKNFKRFITLLLTAAMVAGSSMAVFAEDVNVDGAYYTEPIDVSVPTSAVFKINPAKMTISVNGTVPDAAQALPIVSVPGEVSNNSATMNLKASVAIQSTAKGLELTKTAVTADAKDKLAQIQFGVASTSANAATGTDVFKKSKWELADETDEENRPQFILTNTAGAYKDVFFGFTGTCTAEPEEAWKTGDGVTVKLKFTFVPVDITITENVPATFNAK